VAKGTYPRCIRFSPDGKYIAVLKEQQLSKAGELVIYELGSNKKLTVLSNLSNRSFAWIPSIHF